MGPRTRRASIRGVMAVAWAGLVGACTGAESPEGVVEFGVGNTLPAIGLSGNGPALVWVLTVAQCLGCESGEPARVVRLLQRRFGARIETVVVAVGEGGRDDREVVSAFLASQRISARVESRTPDRYRREFGPRPPSALYVANREAVIEAVVEADSAGTWRSADGRWELAGFVEKILNIVSEGGAPAEEGSGIRQ